MKHSSTIKLNVLILGCGRISRHHFKAVNDNKHILNLVAICDNSQSSVNSFLESNGELLEKDIAIYSNILEVIDDIVKKQLALDFVIIGTPSGLHAEHAYQFAKIGVNCLIEKPLCLKYDDAVQLNKLAQNTGSKISVIHQNRCNSTVQWLKKQVDDKKLGRIFYMNANVVWNRNQEYYDQDSWHGTVEYDGGVLFNQGVHYLDLMSYIAGPVKQANCISKTLSRNIEIDDTAVITLEYEKSALGVFGITMLSYPKNLEGSLLVVGEFGSIKLGGVALNKVEICTLDQDKFSEEKIDTVYGNGHSKFMHEYVMYLLGERENPCSIDESINTIKVIESCYTHGIFDINMSFTTSS